MEKKTFKAAEIRGLGGALFAAWEDEKSKIQLGGKELYNLIALKKKLESEFNTINETLQMIAMGFGGQQLENGGIKIPDDKIAEANAKFTEAGNAEVTIEYSPIKMNENGNVPVGILDALFDFVEQA